MEEMLVSVEHADGVAGVVVDDGRYLLCGYLRPGPRLSIGVDVYDGAGAGLTGDRMVEGGLLPPGAVGAEVVDRAGRRHEAVAGNGGWVIVLDEPVNQSPAVRFFDDSGRTVARPVPDDWQRESVEKLDEPCPACGGVDWDKFRPTGDRWGSRETSHGWEPTPWVVCRKCGHRESVPMIMSAEVDRDVDLAARQAEAEWVRDHREEKAKLLEACSFPVYGIVGLKPRISGYGHKQDELTEVSLWYSVDGNRTIEVLTELEEFAVDSELERARDALGNVLYNAGAIPVPDIDEDSEAAAAVVGAAQDRAIKRTTATAETRRVLIELDAAAKAFELAQYGSHWAAARRHDDLLLVISASGVSPDATRLASIDNIGMALDPGS